MWSRLQILAAEDVGMGDPMAPAIVRVAARGRARRRRGLLRPPGVRGPGRRLPGPGARRTRSTSRSCRPSCWPSGRPRSRPRRSACTPAGARRRGRPCTRGSSAPCRPRPEAPGRDHTWRDRLVEEYRRVDPPREPAADEPTVGSVPAMSDAIAALQSSVERLAAVVAPLDDAIVAQAHLLPSRPSPTCLPPRVGCGGLSRRITDGLAGVATPDDFTPRCGPSRTPSPPRPGRRRPAAMPPSPPRSRRCPSPTATASPPPRAHDDRLRPGGRHAPERAPPGESDGAGHPSPLAGGADGVCLCRTIFAPRSLACPGQ